MFKWLKRFFEVKEFDAYYRNLLEQNKKDTLMLVKQELESITKTLTYMHADKVEEVVNNFAIKTAAEHTHRQYVQNQIDSLAKRLETLEGRKRK